MKQTLWPLTRLTSLVLTAVFVSTLSAQPRVIETATQRFVEEHAGVWLGTGSGSVYTLSNVLVLVG